MVRREKAKPWPTCSMSQLSVDEIAALDKRVDSGINSFAALAMPRPVMAVHLLRVYEDYLRLRVPQLAKGNVDDFLAARKIAQDGLNFAMLWVMQRCPATEDVELSLRGDAYELCGSLFLGAMEYSHVWDFLTLLFRGRAGGEWESANRVRLRYTDEVASEFDVAGRLVASPDPPGLADGIGPEFLEMEELMLKLQPRSVGGGKVDYQLSSNLFAEMKAIHRVLLKHLWELDPNWDFGGYRLADFREVWLALVTFAVAHQQACFRSGAKGWGLASVVPVKRTGRWEKLIARWSDVPRSAVNAILRDLTFTQELYGPRRKQPDITCQPFFPLGSDLVALSISLLSDSNAERNLWDLLSIIRPAVHSTLRNRKEEYWIEALTGWLSQSGLTCQARIPVRLGNERTDLDLLILDRAGRFGLGCQLKWPTAPDRIRDVEYTDKELLVGVDQAELSRRWMATKPVSLRSCLGLRDEELAGMRFEVAVLSKNALGSSLVYRRAPSVPVITERLLMWVLGEPHRTTLQTLWKVANNRSYFAVPNVHYSDETAEAEFAGIQFKGEGLGMMLRQPWTPEVDIKLPDCER
jgi:hypothetical protein